MIAITRGNPNEKRFTSKGGGINQDLERTLQVLDLFHNPGLVRFDVGELVGFAWQPCTSPQSGITSLFSVPLVCIGARWNPATYGTNQEARKRRLGPALRASGLQGGSAVH